MSLSLVKISQSLQKNTLEISFKKFGRISLIFSLLFVYLFFAFLWSKEYFENKDINFIIKKILPVRKIPRPFTHLPIYSKKELFDWSPHSSQPIRRLLFFDITIGR